MRRTATLLIASLCLLACGGETGDPKPDPGSSSGEDDIVIRVLGEDCGSSSSEGGRIARAATPEEEFRLSVSLARKEFEAGQALKATLTLRNVSESRHKLFDPARSLPANLRYAVRAPGGKLVEIEIDEEIPEEAVTEEDLVTVEPGDSVGATLDLAPVLLDVAGGRPGEYVVEVTFTGGHQGGQLTMDVWNRARAKEVTSAPVAVWLRWPNELADAGISWEMDQQVEELLADTNAEGLMRADAERLLADMGPGAYACVATKLAKAASPSHPDQVIGWNAFRFLRSRGDRAAEALAADPSPETPIREMLLAWIEADDRKARNLGADPDEEDFRRAVLDPESRRLESFRLTRTADEGRDIEILTVHGDGLVQYERHQDGRVRTIDGRLEDEELDALMTTLAEDGFWIHTTVRQLGSKEEALLTLEQLHRGEGEEGDLEEVVQSIEVWETEAIYFNRPLARIVQALLGTKLSLGR